MGPPWSPRALGGPGPSRALRVRAKSVPDAPKTVPGAPKSVPDVPEDVSEAPEAFWKHPERFWKLRKSFGRLRTAPPRSFVPRKRPAPPADPRLRLYLSTWLACLDAS